MTLRLSQHMSTLVIQHGVSLELEDVSMIMRMSVVVVVVKEVEIEGIHSFSVLEGLGEIESAND